MFRKLSYHSSTRRIVRVVVTIAVRSINTSIVARATCATAPNAQHPCLFAFSASSQLWLWFLMQAAALINREMSNCEPCSISMIFFQKGEEDLNFYNGCPRDLHHSHCTRVTFPWFRDVGCLHWFDLIGRCSRSTE